MPRALELLAYYDVLDRPLTREELGGEVDDERISSRDGYYYINNREYLVPLRLERERIAKHKWRRMRRIAWFLRLVPFVRAVFASGSLSMNNTDELSDLDVVVIAKHGRIWTTRLLLSGLLSLLRARRKHEDGIAPDKLCPNHFITDQSLGIGFRSMYTAQLYAHLVPLIAVDRALIENFKKENAWVLGYAHRWEMDVKQARRPFVVARLCEWFLARKVGEWMEKKAAAYQQHRIASRTVHLRPGGHVVYNNSVLAFHAGSSEAEILKKYENTKAQLT